MLYENTGFQPISLRDTSGREHIVGAMGGTAVLTPDMDSQNVAELMESSGVLRISPDPVPVCLEPPSIVGDLQVGEVARCEPGVWEGDPVVTRQWLAGGVAVAGATGVTHKLGEIEDGAMIAVVETATVGEASAESVSEEVGPVGS